MKKFGLLLFGMITGIILTIGLLWNGSMRNAQADPGRAAKGSESLGNSPWTVESVRSTSLPPPSSDDELPPANLAADIQGVNVLPTPIPGETLVYFTTADSDATATVVFLYNTDAVAHTVALRGYSYNGVLGYSLNINVPATSLVRLSSDSIAATPPPSWSTPAPIITNFTDFTYFASLSLPRGVRVEGYMLYNGGTGVVDPRTDQGAIPLRFSTDPATVFVPSVQAP